LRIRSVMDCVFKVCSGRDTVHDAIKLMLQERTPYLVAVDDKNRYLGILAVTDLLGYSGTDNATVAGLVQKVTPLREHDPLKSIRDISGNYLPVVNPENMVVGVLSLRSLLEYLPEMIAPAGHERSEGKGDPNLSSKYTIDDIMGQSLKVLSLKERILAAAKTKSTVLVLGETGTGKELVAHAIHRLSERRHKHFVRINCATIPENLLESELFGYEPGAFTGAVKGGGTGKFEIASGGTIFLDEIGDMPLFLQAKILRVLQEREIEKVGGKAPIPVDVRVIAATHCDLLQLVETGKFRKDLYYRLHVVPITVAPLRERYEDIPMLVDYFITKFAVEFDVEKPAVDVALLRDFLAYDWPGNVRELSNVMEAAVSLCNGIINSEHWFRPSADQNKNEESLLSTLTDDAEKEAILAALRQYGGNKIKVADSLGISRSSLYNKLHKYNISTN